MKTAQYPMTYETPMDIEIIEAYMNKNAGAKRSEIRKIRRALRKLTTSSSGWIGTGDRR